MNLHAKNPEPPLEEVAPTAARFEAPPPQLSGWRAGLAAVVQAGLVAAIIAGAWIVWEAIIASAPTADRSPRERVARLVDIIPAAAATSGPVIQAWGTVSAAQTLIVRPEIGGRLNWLHPEVTAGGRLRAGEVVARLDPADLELAVLQARADIADIEARMQIERGQAAVGERELTRLSRDLSPEQKALVRREPQMAQLEAELAAARAVLAQAENALARTEVRILFDALVVSEEVAPGTMVMQGAETATLVASDRFHVILPVPANALSWITVSGHEVVLTQPGIWPDGARRTGKTVRLAATLSETGRMAELIVEVEDPLSDLPLNAGAPQLLLGSFVAGRIEGTAIEGAVALPRAYLRDGDTVWVMGADDTLEIREVAIAWRGADAVLVSAGLAPGERVVTTRLATFTPGMALRTDAAE